MQFVVVQRLIPFDFLYTFFQGARIGDFTKNARDFGTFDVENIQQLLKAKKNGLDERKNGECVFFVSP